MGAFTKGDIVLFPFPYTDLSARKLRPCLVLSDEMKEDILLCQITSRQIQRDQYTIELLQHETTQGSLMVDSYIRANMIFTANKKQILKQVCKIDGIKYQEIIQVIVKMISK